MKRFWGTVSAPTEDSKIKKIRNFIAKHKLCVATVGKDRNKKRILIDVNQQLIKKVIPKDILSHIFSFLNIKERTQLSIISETFQQCVISTNRNDHEITITGFVKQCDYSFGANISLKYHLDFKDIDISVDILLKANNEWMLQNMEAVGFRTEDFRFDTKKLVQKIPKRTKKILQKLLYNTNCWFEMEHMQDVTDFFSHKYFNKGDISLSLVGCWNKNDHSKPSLETINVCQKVTKLKIENSALSMDTINLFSNVIELKIPEKEFFDTSVALQDNETLQPRFSLSTFPKLKHLSIVFNQLFEIIPPGGMQKRSAIHIPKQIETLKMDAIYSKKYDGLPIVIENDSILHTMEIYFVDPSVYSIRKLYIDNFIEILNLCNNLNHLKCLKINMGLSYDSFIDLLLMSTNVTRIKKWKHDEKRTIIVKVWFRGKKEDYLLIENKIQLSFQQLFANDVKLVYQTKLRERTKGDGCQIL